ncbi:hypothetical protein FQZ97_753530 [compost metagenome]
MVEGALRIDSGGKAGFGQEAGDFPGQFRRAGGWVLHGVERWWETVEVMPGLRLGAAAEQQAVAFPVGGDHQYRLGPRQCIGQGLERRAAGPGFQGEHGGAVGDKEAG